MTFPVVADVSYSEETTDTTSHDVLIPANIASGDLLVLFISIDADPVLSNFPAGWQAITGAGGAAAAHAYYKIADGSETNFQYTSSTSDKSGNRCWRISAATWHGTTPPEGNNVEASSNAPNPPSVTASWGSDDNLWAAFWGGGTAVHASYPANYTLYQYNDQTGTANSDANMGLAARELATATEDPGTFGKNASAADVAITVVIRGAAGGGADPEGSLIGGKLIRGGLLLHGVLGR